MVSVHDSSRKNTAVRTGEIVLNLLMVTGLDRPTKKYVKMKRISGNTGILYQERSF
jgi:hypothetical protein